MMDFLFIFFYSETVKCLLGGKQGTVHVDRYTGRLRERIAPSWSFKSLTWGISSWFSLANHFDLPSESVFGISKDPSVCVHIS